MKLKHLESELGQIDDFENPNIELEQYATTPHIAACMLHTIEQKYGDIGDKNIADLGCGCGRLTIGCVMLGASKVYAYDIDEDAMGICRQNLEDCEIGEDDVIMTKQDITDIDLSDPKWHDVVDTVIMNPPFGTKNNEGIDLKFLRVALTMAKSSVYSLHKTARRSHMRRQANEWGACANVEAELRFNLDRSYPFHKHASKDIEVDFLRFTFKDDKTSFKERLKKDLAK